MDKVLDEAIWLKTRILFLRINLFSFLNYRFLEIAFSTSVFCVVSLNKLPL